MDSVLIDTLAGCVPDSTLRSLADRLSAGDPAEMDTLATASALARIVARRRGRDELTRGLAERVAETVCLAVSSPPSVSQSDLLSVAAEIGCASPEVTRLTIAKACVLLGSPAESGPDADPNNPDPDSASGNVSPPPDRLLGLLIRICSSPACPRPVPSRLINLGFALLGSPDRAVSDLARQLCITVIRGIQTTTRSDGDPKDDKLEPRLWARVAALLSAPDEHPKSASLAVWLQFISVPTASIRRRLATPEYRSTVRDCLLDGSDTRRKYALAVLGLSAKTTTDRAETAAVDRFCTVFEAIVLGRYLNQAVEAVAQLDRLVHSFPDRSSIWTLLIAGLGPTVQDRHRAAVGNWCLSASPGFITVLSTDLVAPSTPDIRLLSHRFLLDALLPWICHGHLFLDSIADDADGLPVCHHGDRITRFLSHLLRRLSSSDAAATAVVAAVLTRLNKPDDVLFPLALPFLAAPLVGAATHRPELKQSISAIWTPLADRHGVSPAGRKVLADFDTFFGHDINPEQQQPSSDITSENTITSLWDRVRETDYACLRGPNLDPFCAAAIDALNHHGAGTLSSSDVLANLLRAVWYQFEVDEHPKESLDTVINLILHPSLITASRTSTPITSFIADTVPTLPILARSQMAAFDRLTFHLRTAFFADPAGFAHLGLTSIIVDLVLEPPQVRLDGALDVAISLIPHRLAVQQQEQQGQQGQSHSPPSKQLPDEHAHHRRSWTRLFDLLNRLPALGHATVSSTVSSILKPWADQTEPIPADVLRRKKTIQLQAVFILVEALGRSSPADELYTSLIYLLELEPLPRFRILLEWILVRLVHAHPDLTSRLYRLFLASTSPSPSPSSSPASQKQNQIQSQNPRFVVSLIRVLTATAIAHSNTTTNTEPSIQSLIAALLPTAMSGKVSIRYDSQWALLVLLNHTRTQPSLHSPTSSEHHSPTSSEHHSPTSSSSEDDPILAPTRRYLDSLVECQAGETPGHVAMMKKAGHAHLASLFEGPFLVAAQPVEPALVRERDFIALQADEPVGVSLENFPLVVPFSKNYDDDDDATVPSAPTPTKSTKQSKKKTSTTTPAEPGQLQTKGTAWKTLLSTLSPTDSSPSSSTSTSTSTSQSRHRHDDLIVLGSLLTSATNIGGLTRCAEVFGAGSLLLDSPTTIVTDPSFQAVAVTADRHIPLLPCPRTTDAIVSCLDSFRRRGYAVVGIEQTDSSVVLGSTACVIPKKVVFILGNEHTGIPGPVLANVDTCVEIRQVGVVRSLNVQTAAAVVLAEYWRQHSQ